MGPFESRTVRQESFQASLLQKLSVLPNRGPLLQQKQRLQIIATSQDWAQLYDKLHLQMAFPYPTIMWEPRA